MSITITISGNREYCRANGLVGETRYDCQTCEFDGRKDDCRECAGKGYVAFEDLPFEMNITNSNFRTLWHALGLDFDWDGAIDGPTLVAAISQMGPDMLTKPSYTEGGETSARIVHFGTDIERATRYLTNLLKIANEAARREEKVIWA